MPAYVVLNDRHLVGIAERRPPPKALAACPGIGPAKLAAYGDEILALVTARRARGRRHGVAFGADDQPEAR